MTTTRLLFLTLTLTTGLVATGSLAAQDALSVKEMADSRSEVRKKAESGGATKDDSKIPKKYAVPRMFRKQLLGNASNKIPKDPDGFQLAKGVFSGPQPGEKLGGFSVIPPSRNDEVEAFDPVALAAGKPHLLIFIDDSDIAEAIAGYAYSLMRIREKSRTGLAATVVILGDERQTEIPFTTSEDHWWDIFNTTYQIGYSPDGRDGPGAYGLNRNIVLTIVIADAKGRVLYNFPFRETPQGYDPHVLGGIAEAIGEDRETVASWLKDKEASDSWVASWLNKYTNVESQPKAEYVTPSQIIVSMDKNADGKISRDEASEGLKPHFDQVDTDKDGVIDVKEAKVIADYANQRRAKSMPKESKVEKE